MNNLGAVFIVLALAWIVQLVLSLYQTKRFHQRVATLRKSGEMTAVGLSGSNWKRKVYAVMVVNRDREIVQAEKLSGFTVFARLKPVLSMVGVPVSRLEGEPIDGVHKKLWAAFQNAAAYVKRHDEKIADTEEEEHGPAEQAS